MNKIYFMLWKQEFCHIQSFVCGFKYLVNNVTRFLLFLIKTKFVKNWKMSSFWSNTQTCNRNEKKLYSVFPNYKVYIYRMMLIGNKNFIFIIFSVFVPFTWLLGKSWFVVNNYLKTIFFLSFIFLNSTFIIK